MKRRPSRVGKWSHGRTLLFALWSLLKPPRKVSCAQRRRRQRCRCRRRRRLCPFKLTRPALFQYAGHEHVGVVSSSLISNRRFPSFLRKHPARGYDSCHDPLLYLLSTSVFLLFLPKRRGRGGGGGTRG